MDIDGSEPTFLDYRSGHLNSVAKYSLVYNLIVYYHYSSFKEIFNSHAACWLTHKLPSGTTSALTDEKFCPLA